MLDTWLNNVAKSNKVLYKVDLKKQREKQSRLT